MKSFTFLLVWVLCLWQTEELNAQKLTLSDKVDFNLRVDDFAIVGRYEGNYVLYYRHDDQPELLFLNQDMRKVKSLKLDFIPEKFNAVFTESVPDGILICYQVKEEKRKKVYAAKLTANYTLSAPILVMDLEDATIQDMDDAMMVSSANKQYHLVYASGLHEGSVVIKASVMDADLHLKNNISQVISADKSWVVSSKACVSNTGDAVMLLSSKPSSKGASEELKILMSHISQTQLGVYPVALNKHYASDIQLTVDNKNQLFYLGGLYSDGKYNSPKGLFFTSFDPSLKANTVSHFTSVSSQLSGANDLRDYRLRQMNIKEDGGVEFAAEKYFQNVRTITSMNPTLTMGFMTVPEQTRTVNEFFYDEVVVFNLKPDGLLGWSQTILKQQQSSDDAGIYSSIGILNHSSGHAYFFADINTRQPRLMVAYMANNSDLMIRELPTTEEINEWNWMPRSAEQLSKSEIMIPCLSKNYLCFLKISY